ncbi:MAG: hypothetical protein HOW73_40620 [Polyangiaceae bacterium]|nr:hypothetical protein [Polyangiaceae bacterium]
MQHFLNGSIAALAGTAACFFLRFFLRSGERLFLYFSLAFLCFFANYLVLGLSQTSVESRHYVYVIRLIAFGLIIVGILDKNRRS